MFLTLDIYIFHVDESMMITYQQLHPRLKLSNGASFEGKIVFEFDVQFEKPFQDLNHKIGNFKNGWALFPFPSTLFHALFFKS